MDLSTYKTPTLYQSKKAPAYRFQELIVEAIDKFKIEKCWQQMVWGIFGRVKRTNESFATYQLERAIRETEQHNPSEPSKYFIKLLIKFLKGTS